nr:hypothetical protein [uncultured Flavobacterium sp.]
MRQKKNTILFFALIFLMSLTGFAQDQSFAFAKKESREKLLIKLKDSIINQEAIAYLNFNKNINWNSYAWATAFVIDNSEQNFKVLKKALSDYELLSKRDVKKVFESVFACFPTEFVLEMTDIAENEAENVSIFATSIHYLAQNNIEVKKFLQTKFTNDNSAVMQALRNELKSDYKPISIADLIELVKFNAAKKEKFLYSIQHTNRELPGKAFVQNKNGFLEKENGKVILVDQLARSATNLPMYITNGNTPTGLFKIESLAKSENVFIGPTLSFVTFLPFECDASVYYNNDKKDFLLEDYLKFFPKKLHSNLSIQQTFWAGKAGRGEIHFHGTTIDQELYKNQIFYGQTPSMGCLCAKEIWNENGNLVQSDQQKLIDLWQKSNTEKGYAYILELQESDWIKFEKSINTKL